MGTVSETELRTTRRVVVDDDGNESLREGRGRKGSACVGEKRRGSQSLASMAMAM